MRRSFPTLLALGLLLCAPLAASAFGLDDVSRQAEQLAKKPYAAPATLVPEYLASLDYAHYREIRFRPEQAVWRKEGLPFQLQFFHPGHHYTRPVRIHLIEQNRVRSLPFRPEAFDYGSLPFEGRVPKDLGWAGFRIHTPLNAPSSMDEVAVFLGGTYFRALGQNMHYGLSARGIAIDTAEAKGEEFPAFTDFWIEQPATGSKKLTVLALMDSASLTGAYRFIIEPGRETVMQVEARLFARTGVRKLGLAPLTSMFLHGEATGNTFGDFRPEEHDSDGLLIHAASGEWLWRPLENAPQVRINRFAADHVRGFGLMQRDRNFDHYQDLAWRYEDRPSLWIEPMGDWGAGGVELVRLPSDNSTLDNVVAYFVPVQPLQAGQTLRLAWRMRWLKDDAGLPGGARVIATRLSTSNTERLPENQGVVRYVIDFAGGDLARLRTPGEVEAVSSLHGTGRIRSQRLEPNPHTQGWRLTLFVEPPGEGTAELRAFLKRGEAVLSETWSAAYPP
ncbi:MAG: glucan biosynthesis protein [Halothiobacillaceae bacterium]